VRRHRPTATPAPPIRVTTLGGPTRVDGPLGRAVRHRRRRPAEPTGPNRKEWFATLSTDPGCLAFKLEIAELAKGGAS
jgi:hypothetical protein